MKKFVSCFLRNRNILKDCLESGAVWKVTAPFSDFLFIESILTD